MNICSFILKGIIIQTWIRHNINLTKCNLLHPGLVFKPNLPVALQSMTSSCSGSPRFSASPFALSGTWVAPPAQSQVTEVGRHLLNPQCSATKVHCIIKNTMIKKEVNGMLKFMLQRKKTTCLLLILLLKQRWRLWSGVPNLWPLWAHPHHPAQHFDMRSNCATTKGQLRATTPLAFWRQILFECTKREANMHVKFTIGQLKCGIVLVSDLFSLTFFCVN